MPANPSDGPITASTLTDYQFALDYFKMGKAASPAGLASGSTISIVQVTGLDTPDANTTTSTRLKGHGSFITSRYHKERVITISGRINTTAAHYPQDVAALNMAFLTRPEPVTFFFKLPGQAARMLDVLPQGVKYNMTSVETAVGWVDFLATMTAADPRIYNAVTLKSVSCAAGGTVGGGADLTPFPYDWSTASAPTIAASNVGNTSAPIVLTLHGPLTNPTFEDFSTGEAMGLVITLASGHDLVIDSVAKTVILDGTTSQYATLASGSKFIEIPASCLGRFGLSVASGAGSADITWRDTWL